MAKIPTFNEAINEIAKKYGPGVVVNAARSPQLKRIKRLETGIFALDLATGGGLPMGRAIHMKGKESSGKSLIAMKALAALQRLCRNCGKPRFAWDEQSMKKTPIECCKRPQAPNAMWVDAEGVWEDFWAERLGVDTSELYVMKSTYAEQVIDAGSAVLTSGADMIVVDSIAQLVPSVELEVSAEKWQQGVASRLMAKMMRVWTSDMNARYCDNALPPTVIFINQIRMKIGVMYGNPETTTGGNSINFYSSLTGNVKRKGVLKSADEHTIGTKIEVVFEKNKTSPPMEGATFDLAFVPLSERRKAGSTDYAAQVLRAAKRAGIVLYDGSWITLAKDVKFQGAQQAVEFLESPGGAAVLKMLRDEVWRRESAFWDGAAIMTAASSEDEKEDADGKKDSGEGKK